jgi:hypothetical protein
MAADRKDGSKQDQPLTARFPDLYILVEMPPAFSPGLLHQHCWELLGWNFQKWEVGVVDNCRWSWLIGSHGCLCHIFPFKVMVSSHTVPHTALVGRRLGQREEVTVQCCIGNQWRAGCAAQVTYSWARAPSALHSWATFPG